MPQPRRATPGPDGSAPLPRWSMVLRALRESGGITQDGWAAHLGYSRATVQRWERGQAIPDSAAEQALVALCAERGLLRSFDHGPLAGLTMTPDFLRDLLAEARAAGGIDSVAALPENMTRLFGRLRQRYAEPATAPPIDTGAAAEQPAVPTNLPVPATSFVGREQERRDLARLLEGVRLLTIAGVGGIGKTRLAIEAGRETAARYRDGVWLVDLGSLSDPALVPAAAAAVFGVREQPGRPLTETLTAALENRQALLILDNCEHLLGASADLAGDLLRGCPDLRVLATSRTPLGLSVETVWRAPPMTVPGSTFHVPGREGASVEPGTWNPELEQADAIRLFVERATAAMPTFRLTAANAGSVAHICRRLDGMPLAIELAAARVRILAPEQIAARLDERFRLLGSGEDAAPRHRTLQAALDWSYDLLTEAEQRLLARLAVFAGGCDIEAVEAVCAGGGIDPARVFDLLTYLVDRSLVVVEHRGGAARYRLLETVRVYALERLERMGALSLLQERHVGYFTALAEREESRLVGREQPVAMARLNEEVDNFRAAFAYALEGNDGARAAELAIRLWRFWLLSGRAGEGRGWIARTVATGASLPPALHARLLDAAGTLAHVQGAYEESQRAHEQSLEIWRELGDLTGTAGAVGSLGLALKSRGNLDGAARCMQEALVLWRAAGQDARVAMLLNNLAAVAMDQGDFERADRYQEESLALKRRAGDQAGIATSLHNLAETARHRGRYERAAALIEESLAIFRGLGLKAGLAQSLHSAGVIACRLGEHERAAASLRESLTLFDELDLRWGIPLCLEALAEVRVIAGDPRTAARLLGAAEAIREEIGAPLAPSDRPAHDTTVTAIRAVLSAETLSAVWAAGRALSFEQAIESGLAQIGPASLT